MKQGYVSIDLGGTNIACAIAGEDMTLLGETSVPTESHLGPEGVIERIGDVVSTACRNQGHRTAWSRDRRAGAGGYWSRRGALSS